MLATNTEHCKTPRAQAQQNIARLLEPKLQQATMLSKTHNCFHSKLASTPNLCHKQHLLDLRLQKVNKRHWAVVVNFPGVHSVFHRATMCCNVHVLVSEPKFLVGLTSTTKHRMHFKLNAIQWHSHTET